MIPQRGRFFVLLVSALTRGWGGPEAAQPLTRVPFFLVVINSFVPSHVIWLDNVPTSLTWSAPSVSVFYEDSPKGSGNKWSRIFRKSWKRIGLSSDASAVTRHRKSSTSVVLFDLPNSKVIGEIHSKLAFRGLENWQRNSSEIGRRTWSVLLRSKLLSKLAQNGANKHRRSEEFQEVPTWYIEIVDHFINLNVFQTPLRCQKSSTWWRGFSSTWHAT